MKNLFILTVFALIALTSCKKDYTCTCTVDFMGQPISTSTTINATKADAEKACEAGNTTGVVCEIK